MTLPVAAVLAKALYGETVDAAEFAKQIDAADVHIDGPLVAAKRRKPKRGTDQLVPAPVKLAQRATEQERVVKSAPAGEHKKTNKTAAIGLGASGVASVAGIHALTATRGENAHRRATLEGKAPVMKPPGRLAAKLTGKLGPKKAAALLGGGLLGLHGVELLGDALAVHTQARQLKKPVAKGMPKISLRPVNPAQARKVVSLKARRPAGSPPPMAKGIKGVLSTGRNVKRIAESSAAATKNVEEITGKMARLVPKPKTAALALGGLTAAGIGGRGVATYEGSKHGVQRGLRKEFTAPVLIAKRDDELKQVFGWASVSVKDGELVVDRQGDIIHIGEIEKMAYDYVQDSRVGGDQHQRINKWAFSTDLGPRKTATMIESMVFTPEKIEKMGLPGDFPQGWWVGYQIQDDAVWDDIRSGRRTGFSIHGTGRRTPVPGEMVGVAKGQRTDDLREGYRQGKTHARYARQMGRARLSAVRAGAEASGKESTIGVPIPGVYIRHRPAHRAGGRVGAVAGATGSPQLRERTRQAIHPPPVKRKAVESAAMTSLGYQPQTRKLAIQMRSREEPYNYRVDQATADAVLTAPSKGKAYHAHIRNKAQHHTRYRVSDRARLFAHPDRVEKADRKTKALMGGVLGGSATAVGASAVKVHRALNVRDAARRGEFEMGTERRALKQAVRPANRAAAAGMAVALGSAGGLVALGARRDVKRRGGVRQALDLQPRPGRSLKPKTTKQWAETYR